MARKSIIYGGEAVTNNGTAVPMVIDNGTALSRIRGGFSPDRLDAVIELLIDNADSGARLLQMYTPMLAGLMDALQVEVREFLMGAYGEDGSITKPELEAIFNMVNKISIIMERLNKMQLNAVKAKDDATRLRMELAGEQQHGLENMSENDLRRIVSEAADGWVKPDGD